MIQQMQMQIDLDFCSNWLRKNNMHMARVDHPGFFLKPKRIIMIPCITSG
jgi:hypothetical protein